MTWFDLLIFATKVVWGAWIFAAFLVLFDVVWKMFLDIIQRIDWSALARSLLKADV